MKNLLTVAAICLAMFPSLLKAEETGTNLVVTSLAGIPFGVSEDALAGCEAIDWAKMPKKYVDFKYRTASGLESSLATDIPLKTPYEGLFDHVTIFSTTKTRKIWGIELTYRMDKQAFYRKYGYGDPRKPMETEIKEFGKKWAAVRYDLVDRYVTGTRGKGIKEPLYAGTDVRELKNDENMILRTCRAGGVRGTFKMFFDNKCTAGLILESYVFANGNPDSFEILGSLLLTDSKIVDEDKLAKEKAKAEDEVVGNGTNVVIRSFLGIELGADEDSIVGNPRFDERAFGRKSHAAFREGKDGDLNCRVAQDLRLKTPFRLFDSVNVYSTIDTRKIYKIEMSHRRDMMQAVALGGLEQIEKGPKEFLEEWKATQLVLERKYVEPNKGMRKKCTLESDETDVIYTIPAEDSTLKLTAHFKMPSNTSPSFVFTANLSLVDTVLGQQAKDATKKAAEDAFRKQKFLEDGGML